MTANLSAEQRHLTSLQERFIKSGLEALDDSEVIELLLGAGLSCNQCRMLRKN